VFMFWSLVPSCKIKSSASASASASGSASADGSACAGAWQYRGTAGKLEVRWVSVCRCPEGERGRGAFRKTTTVSERFSRKEEMERALVSVRVSVCVVKRKRLRES